MDNFLFLFKRVFNYLKKYKLGLLLALICIIILTLSGVLQPYIIGFAITELGNNLVDIARGTGGINFPYIGRVILVYFINGIVNAITTFGASTVMAFVIQRSMRDLRADVSDKVNKVPVSFFDSHQQGDILSIVTNDVDAISNALQQGMVNITLNIFQVTMSIIMMFILSWKGGLVIITALFINIILGKTIISRSQPVYQKQANAIGDLFGFTQEQLSGYTEITAYNQQDLSIDLFKEKNQLLYRLGQRATFLSQILNPIMSTVFNLSYVFIFAVGGISVLNQNLSLGNFQAILSYVGNVRGPINNTTQQIPVVQSALASANRVFRFLDEEEEESQNYNKSLPVNLKGQVVFENVSFGYDKNNPLMTDVSFKAEPGQTIAIVGPTGAGKTTLINLLMRFYEIDGGAIYVDGVNIKEVTREDLRSHMGMVLQDAWLFSDTVMENIRFGNLDATDIEVMEACKTANVDSFIKTLPGGYNMVIEEDGSNISQGQRQLMTIARAIISNPDILILDEATSSVDTRLEQLIQDAMDKVMEGRTSFVIAHRLSTIKNADQILVMKDGDIIETGRHEELMEKDGFYADLYNAQFSQDDDPADIHMEY